MDYQEKRNFYKSRGIILEMLKDRDYEVPEDFFKLSFDDFMLLIEKNNIDLYFSFNKEKNKDLLNKRKDVYVSFLYQYQKAINKKEFDSLMNKIEKHLDKPISEIELILIFRIMPSKTTSDMLEQLKIQYFFINNLVFNPTKHSLVPEHRLLKVNEAKEVLNRYNSTRLQLPKISRSDVIAKYYGFRTGDVIEIKRISPNSGIHYFYRVVV